jgi:pyruvate dehydrogenase E2 component (dihydrolipoamide acetyltransferase)
VTDQVFLLPDLGEGLTEATILSWLVSPGETVAIDQVVVEVETAKASVEVPIPFAGVVATLHGREGETLQVGTPLITVDSGEAAPGAPQQLQAYETHRTEERAGSGNVLIGYGTADSPAQRRRRPDGRPSGQQLQTAHAPAAPTAAPRAPAAGPARVISPVVRNLARRYGLDLDRLAETVDGAVITRATVERALAEQAQAAPSSPSPRDQVIPITGFRKAVADKLTASRREIPDATAWVDADATELVAARLAINAVQRDEDIVSLMSLLARLAVAALQHFPELNATVDSQRNEITQYGGVHLGIAAQTPRGLVVPVIRDADQLNTIALHHALKETIASAREGKLRPERLTGGSFTLNNYGVFGTDGSTPIINHPESAILGIGRIIDRPWVHAGEIAIRKMTQITVSFDHRVCDGAVAGGFLRRFADYVENPVAVLGSI